MRWLPSDAEYAALLRKIKVTTHATLLDNALFHALYHHKTGLYPRRGAKNEWRQERDGSWTRLKRNLSRREWIEEFFPIRTKIGEIVKIKLNSGQRKLECWILRMERAGVPIRVVILKARQLGFSTYVQAVLFEMILRGEQIRGVIVADNAKRSEVLLQIASVARTKMEKEQDDGRSIPWAFRLTSKAKYSLAWDTPIYGQIDIESAETEDCARGATPTFIHKSETAMWENAEEVDSSLMQALPTLPGTMSFNESTAKGDQNKFHDDFQKAWKLRDMPLRARPAGTSLALFFAWFEEPSYRWTRSYGFGRTLPSSLVREIQETADKEEKWLMEQTYYRRWEPTDQWVQATTWDREELVIEGKGKDAKITGLRRTNRQGAKRWRRFGVGEQKVDVDQLAWRRATIVSDGFGGDMDKFNREFPGRPEQAFLSSGRPVFDRDRLGQRRVKAKEFPPIFRGFLVEGAAERA